MHERHDGVEVDHQCEARVLHRGERVALVCTDADVDAAKVADARLLEVMAPLIRHRIVRGRHWRVLIGDGLQKRALRIRQRMARVGIERCLRGHRATRLGRFTREESERRDADKRESTRRDPQHGADAKPQRADVTAGFGASSARSVKVNRHAHLKRPRLTRKGRKLRLAHRMHDARVLFFVGHVAHFHHRILDAPRA